MASDENDKSIPSHEADDDVAEADKEDGGVSKAKKAAHVARQRLCHTAPGSFPGTRLIDNLLNECEDNQRVTQDGVLSPEELNAQARAMVTAEIDNRNCGVTRYTDQLRDGLIVVFLLTDDDPSDDEAVRSAVFCLWNAAIDSILAVEPWAAMRGREFRPFRGFFDSQKSAVGEVRRAALAVRVRESLPTSDGPDPKGLLVQALRVAVARRAVFSSVCKAPFKCYSNCDKPPEHAEAIRGKAAEVLQNVFYAITGPDLQSLTGEIDTTKERKPNRPLLKDLAFERLDGLPEEVRDHRLVVGLAMYAYGCARNEQKHLHDPKKVKLTSGETVTVRVEPYSPVPPSDAESIEGGGSDSPLEVAGTRASMGAVRGEDEVLGKVVVGDVYQMGEWRWRDSGVDACRAVQQLLSQMGTEPDGWLAEFYPPDANVDEGHERNGNLMIFWSLQRCINPNGVWKMRDAPDGRMSLSSRQRVSRLRSRVEPTYLDRETVRVLLEEGGPAGD